MVRMTTPERKAGKMGETQGSKGRFGGLSASTQRGLTQVGTIAEIREEAHRRGWGKQSRENRFTRFPALLAWVGAALLAGVSGWQLLQVVFLAIILSGWIQVGLLLAGWLYSWLQADSPGEDSRQTHTPEDWERGG